MVHIDEVSGLVPLSPRGRNSTFFTSCCRTAITDREKRCPECGKKVIGWDADSKESRHRIRWNHAYTG